MRVKPPLSDFCCCWWSGAGAGVAAAIAVWVEEEWGRPCGENRVRQVVKRQSTAGVDPRLNWELRERARRRSGP